jgi:hypothetical protein
VAARERTTTSKRIEDASGGVRGEKAVGLTVISAYGCRGKAASCAVSSSAAVRGMASCEPTRSASCWHDAGIPVMGSRRVRRWAMVHAGEMRRSVEKPAEETCRGTSAAEVRDIGATRGWRSGGGVWSWDGGTARDGLVLDRVGAAGSEKQVRWAPTRRLTRALTGRRRRRAQPVRRGSRAASWAAPKQVRRGQGGSLPCRAWFLGRRRSPPHALQDAAKHTRRAAPTAAARRALALCVPLSLLHTLSHSVSLSPRPPASAKAGALHPQ